MLLDVEEAGSPRREKPSHSIPRSLVRPVHNLQCLTCRERFGRQDRALAILRARAKPGRELVPRVCLVRVRERCKLRARPGACDERGETIRGKHALAIPGHREDGLDGSPPTCYGRACRTCVERTEKFECGIDDVDTLDAPKARLTSECKHFDAAAGPKRIRPRLAFDPGYRMRDKPRSAGADRAESGHSIDALASVIDRRPRVARGYAEPNAPVLTHFARLQPFHIQPLGQARRVDPSGTVERLGRRSERHDDVVGTRRRAYEAVCISDDVRKRPLSGLASDAIGDPPMEKVRMQPGIEQVGRDRARRALGTRRGRGPSQRHGPPIQVVFFEFGNSLPKHAEIVPLVREVASQARQQGFPSGFLANARIRAGESPRVIEQVLQGVLTQNTLTNRLARFENLA